MNWTATQQAVIDCDMLITALARISMAHTVEKADATITILEKLIVEYEEEDNTRPEDFEVVRALKAALNLAKLEKKSLKAFLSNRV